MDILNKKWLDSKPHDYEFKRYKLLAAINKYESLIKQNILAPVLEEIEIHLENLYRFQHQKDLLDDKMKVLVGIDIDNMQLEYEYPENSGEMEDMVKIASDAVYLFEKLYKTLRERWRDHEKKIHLTYIPEKKLVFDSGYFIIIDYNNNLIIYSFNKPSSMNDNWKKFQLTYVETLNFNMKNLTDYVTQIGITEPDKAVIRCDFESAMPFDECAFPIAKFSLFHKLKHG
jgi:hypothetical protein